MIGSQPIYTIVYKVCIIKCLEVLLNLERVKPEIQSKVKEALLELVERAGNVTAFAKSIDVSRDSVNNWLSGRSDIRLNDLVKIAEKYNVTADWLLGLSSASTRDRSMEGAVTVTGLNEKSIMFLRDHGKGSGVLNAINLLLDDERPDNYKYWDRVQRYLFAPPGNYELSISLEGIITTREELYATLLTANSAYLKSLRDQRNGGGK